MLSLFPDLVQLPAGLPAGFHYVPEFLSHAEEAELLELFGRLPLNNSTYQEYTARRRSAGFSLLAADQLPEGKTPAPQLLKQLASRVADHFDFQVSALQHALVTEYPTGAPMGWHRDAPPHTEIFGVSLASACRFRLRPMCVAGPEASAAERRRASLSLELQPRSLYCMSGPARSDWQHAIAAVRELRYSVTFRTLQKQLK